MLDDLFGLVVVAGLVVLLVMVVRQNGRLKLLERELGALSSFVLSSAPATPAVPPAAEAVTPPLAPDLADAEREALPAETASPAVFTESAGGPVGDEVDAIAARAASDGDVSSTVPAGDTLAREPDAAPAAAARRGDLETALGTQWAVWVGGIALALGGIFLVRYSIEAGWFGPKMRIFLAALFGGALLGAGEFVRRTGYRTPAPAAAGAYIPAILTAAGSFTLFATVYASHALYGFIGPAPTFVLLAIVALATLALALVHGQALAGIGLLGAIAAPALVSSEAPNAWVLFGYLALVLVASLAIARIRDWRFLASASFVGVGLWCLGYMAQMDPVDLNVVLFINLVMVGGLAIVWSGRTGAGPWQSTTSRLFPSAIAAFFVGLAACALAMAPGLAETGGTVRGTVLLAAMLAVAWWRIETLPLLFGAGIATIVVLLRNAMVGHFVFSLLGEDVYVDGFGPAVVVAALGPSFALLAALFLGAGLLRARYLVATRPVDAACWAFFGSLVPLVAVVSLWLVSGNPNIDLFYAATALLLAVLLAAGAEAIARSEQPPLTGGLPVTFALAGAGLAAVVGLHAAFGPGMTTVACGVAAVLPALATRWRSFAVLGWLSVGAAVLVIVRVAMDPTIVGQQALSTTPVFNALLPGYGIPALAFGFAAWQLARTTGGRPRLAMEAAAALFALLTVAMLVRHAMNGGVIDDSVPTLAEQAIYSLIALGAGAMLIAIDLRSPSPVMRFGSIGIGVLSTAVIVTQHFGALNPLFTNEDTGAVPVFNLLFLAYLLPAVAAGALAWYARGKRPRWYAVMLALTASALAFAYATLSVRRLFKGQFIGWWSGLEQLETYSYSALWLGLGVALLVVGVRSGSYALRAASGALIAIAVAKVFLFDMSELEGVLRALSFIGLGAVLIGIGLFYQKLLRKAAA
jgi:uncharacterized membrane protein